MFTMATTKTTRCTVTACTSTLTAIVMRENSATASLTARASTSTPPARRPKANSGTENTSATSRMLNFNFCRPYLHVRVQSADLDCDVELICFLFSRTPLSNFISHYASPPTFTRLMSAPSFQLGSLILFVQPSYLVLKEHLCSISLK